MPNRLTETLDSHDWEFESAVSINLQTLLTGKFPSTPRDDNWIIWFNFSRDERIYEKYWLPVFVLFACFCAEVDDETLDAIIEAIKTGGL